MTGYIKTKIQKNPQLLELMKQYIRVEQEISLPKLIAFLYTSINQLRNLIGRIKRRKRRKRRRRSRQTHEG